MAPSRVSIRDVAKTAGVSPSAVSRVLNNNDYISDDKRERIENAIRRLGYRPNALARGLVKSRSRTIGLCLPYLNSPFISNLMEGIDAESERLGYDVFMCHTRNDPERERLSMERMLSRQVEGMIVMPTTHRKHYFEEFLHIVPTMFLLRKPAGITRSLVYASDNKAARRSFSLLLERGHRDIGIIGGPRGVSTIRDRWRAIRSLLREYGVTIPPERIVETGFNYREGYLGVKQLLEQRPGAVYVMHYWAASAMARQLYEHDIRVPRDLSVVFYESFEDECMTFPTRIATNVFPSRRIGTAAVANLHNLISRGQLFMDANLEIDQTFFPHNSVRDLADCAAGGKKSASRV